MFLSGLGASAVAPQIVLFLVKGLGTPLPIAGLYYLTNLTAPIAGYLVGNHSDHTGERLILFRLCALAGFAGWAAIALSTKVWMPFLISSLVLAFSVAASSQLFAAVRDDLDQEAQGSSEGRRRDRPDGPNGRLGHRTDGRGLAGCRDQPARHALDDRSVRPCSDHPTWDPQAWPSQATDSNSSSVERLTAITLAHNSAATRVHRSLRARLRRRVRQIRFPAALHGRAATP